MPKYVKLRSFLATNGFDWVSSTVTAVVLSNYTFVETHASLADIQASGATVVAVARLNKKTVTTDGWAASQPVTIPVLPAGTYVLVLMQDVNGKPTGIFPLVAFSSFATSTTGDVIVRPENSLTAGTGTWFRF